MNKRTRMAVVGIVAAIAFGGGLTVASAQEGGARGPDNAPLVTDQPVANAVTPPTFTEDQFVPVTPCRLVDTRQGGGDFAAGEIRSFVVHGTASFPAQGGKSGGCGIPVGATSVSVSMTAVDSGGSGFVRAWPEGKSEPNATVLNYDGDVSTGTGATVAIRPTAGAALKVKNYAGPTHLVIDVTGYTIPPIAAVISSSGQVYTGTSRVVSATRTATGLYSITVDRSVAGCQPIVSMHGSTFYASAYEVEPNKVAVQTWELSGGNPVNTDLFFTFYMAC